MLPRRTFLLTALAAPAIIRSPGSLMRLRPLRVPRLPRPWSAAQIAEQLVSVQPIDPKPFFDLYNLLKPCPEFPNGRVLTFGAR